MNCVICKSSTVLVKELVYKCSNCDHIYIAYQGDGTEFHKTLYRTPGNDGVRNTKEIQNRKFTKLFHDLRVPICNKRLKKIIKYLTNVKSLLDVGAGGGTFLNTVKGKVDLVEGTEVSDICNENLLDQNLKVYHGSFSELSFDRKYDMVTCWHVLEHIQDPYKFKDKFLETTNDLVILEVPINRRLKTPVNSFDGHFHYFSEKSLMLLFQDKFDILEISEGIQSPALFCALKKKQ